MQGVHALGLAGLSAAGALATAGPHWELSVEPEPHPTAPPVRLTHTTAASRSPGTPTTASSPISASPAGTPRRRHPMSARAAPIPFTDGMNTSAILEFDFAFWAAPEICGNGGGAGGGSGGRERRWCGSGGTGERVGSLVIVPVGDRQLQSRPQINSQARGTPAVQPMVASTRWFVGAEFGPATQAMSTAF